MTSLILEPGQPVDDQWCERARALTPAEQDVLLARADEIRDVPGGTTAAYGCYKALANRLDVRRPLDAERAIWLLGHMHLPDLELEGLARAAAASEHGTELWIQGEFRTAQMERDVGRVDEAITRLFQLLSAVQGNDHWEALILANISLCLQQQNREVESMVVCRRAITACKRAGDLRPLVRSRQLLAGILVSFHDWERYDRICEQVAIEFESLDEADRPLVKFAELLIRSQAAFERQEYDRSLALLDRVTDTYPHRDAWAVSTRAYVLAVMGTAEEARAVLDAEPKAGPQYDLLRATTRLLSTIALEPSRQVETQARRYLERLASGGDPPGHRVSMLLHIARGLSAHEDLLPLAKRTYDFAAAAIVERIVEVDRFVTQRPGLIELTADERSILGGLRVRLLAQQSELMASVAELLKAARKRGESMPSDWYGEKGVLSVCAWCGRLRRGDDGWVPIGAFIPNDVSLELSHDICQDCYADRSW